MDANKVRFEDIPMLMSSILSEMKELHSKVDSIGTLVTGMQEKQPNKVLSIDDVSKLLHKSRSTVYKMVSRNVIPCYKQGKSVTFLEEEVMEWLTTFKRGSCTQVMALAEQYMQRLQ